MQCTKSFLFARGPLLETPFCLQYSHLKHQRCFINTVPQHTRGPNLSNQLSFEFKAYPLFPLFLVSEKHLMAVLRPRKERDRPAVDRNGKGQSAAARRSSEALAPQTLLQKRVRRARDRILAHQPQIEEMEMDIADAIERLDWEYHRSRNRTFTSLAFSHWFLSMRWSRVDLKDDPEEGRGSNDAVHWRSVHLDVHYRKDIKWIKYDDAPMAYDQTPFFIAWASEAPEHAQASWQENEMNTEAASNVSEATFVAPSLPSDSTDATTEEINERYRPKLAFAAQGFFVQIAHQSCQVATGFAHVEACWITDPWYDGLSPEVREKVTVRDRLKAMGTVLPRAIGHSLMHKQMGGTGLAIAMTGECFSRVLAVSPSTVVLELSTTTRDLSTSTASRKLRSSSMRRHYALAHEFSNVAAVVRNPWRGWNSFVINRHAVSVFRDSCRLCVHLMGSAFGPNGFQPFRGHDIDLDALLGGAANTLDCSKSADLAKLCEIFGEGGLEEISEPIEACRPKYAGSGSSKLRHDVKPSDSISTTGREESNAVWTLKALRKCGTLVRVVSFQEMDLVLQKFEKDLP